MVGRRRRGEQPGDYSDGAREAAFARANETLEQRRAKLLERGQEYQAAARRFNEARRDGRLTEPEWAQGMAEVIVAQRRWVISPSGLLAKAAVSILGEGIISAQPIAAWLEEQQARSQFGIVPEHLRAFIRTHINDTGKGSLTRAVFDPVVAALAIHRAAEQPEEVTYPTPTASPRPIGYVAGYIASLSPGAREIVWKPSMDWQRSVQVAQGRSSVLPTRADAYPPLKDAVTNPAVGQAVRALLAPPSAPA